MKKASRSHTLRANVVPNWARGTFIWRLCLADRADTLVEAAETIAAVANSLDHAVEHIVFLSGAIGADEGRLPWDVVWPYWQRLTWRIGGGWEELSRFMVEMRDRHRTRISFHVNCTEGTDRTGPPPESWADVTEVQLIPLTENGRDLATAQTLTVKDGACQFWLGATAAAVLISSGEQPARTPFTTKDCDKSVSPEQASASRHVPVRAPATFHATGGSRSQGIREERTAAGAHRRMNIVPPGSSPQTIVPSSP